MESTTPDEEALLSVFNFDSNLWYKCLVGGCGNNISFIVSCTSHSFSQIAKGMVGPDITNPCTMLMCSIHASKHVHNTQILFAISTPIGTCFANAHYNNITALERTSEYYLVPVSYRDEE